MLILLLLVTASFPALNPLGLGMRLTVALHSHLFKQLLQSHDLTVGSLPLRLQLLGQRVLLGLKMTRQTRVNFMLIN